jgi:hypothetical protein
VGKLLWLKWENCPERREQSSLPDAVASIICRKYHILFKFKNSIYPLLWCGEF